MGVFQRKASTSSVAGSTSKPSPPSRSNTASFSKASKPTKPSLVQRVSTTVKPAPKPRPSLLRRATTGLSEFDSSSWEKRMLKRIEKFPKDHPLLMKLIGAGLVVAGAGAGAVTMPAIMGLLGMKLAVVNGATVMASGVAAAQGSAAVVGALAAGAKIFASTVALDVGGKLLAGPSTPQRLGGLFGRRRQWSTSSDSLPLLPSRT